MNFNNLEPISSYIAQAEALSLEEMPTDINMQFEQEKLAAWMFEPLDGIMLGICGPEAITAIHKKRFHCDVPMMIFMLLLEGECFVHFDQRPSDYIRLEKNMFSWGDWSYARGTNHLPVQTQYCHVSFSIRLESFQQHFGKQTGAKILNHLQKSLVQAGKDVTHAAGLANPDLIAAGRRLITLPRETHMDMLELKAASVEFVSKMLRNIAHFDGNQTVSYSHQDIEAIQSLKRRLETDLFASSHVLDFCAEAGMSRSKAATIFKQIYNTTIGKYHHVCKLMYAHEMLASKKRNVSECAYELGYTNIGHFIAAFHKHYGCTPGDMLALGKAATGLPGPFQQSG